MRIWPHKRLVVLRLLPVLLAILWLAPGHAADFTLYDLDNVPHKLSDYRGKWVVVNYWATWCPPCREEIPELIFFHDAHKDHDAVVLGINFEDAPNDKVRAFLDDYLVSYPVLLSEPEEYGPLGRIRGLPTTFLVSPTGNVVYTHLGAVNVDYLNKLLDEFKGRESP